MVTKKRKHDTNISTVASKPKTNDSRRLSRNVLTRSKSNAGRSLSSSREFTRSTSLVNKTRHAYPNRWSTTRKRTLRRKPAGLQDIPTFMMYVLDSLHDIFDRDSLPEQIKKLVGSTLDRKKNMTKEDHFANVLFNVDKFIIGKRFTSLKRGTDGKGLMFTARTFTEWWFNYAPYTQNMKPNTNSSSVFSNKLALIKKGLMFHLKTLGQIGVQPYDFLTERRVSSKTYAPTSINVRDDLDVIALFDIIRTYKLNMIVDAKKQSFPSTKQYAFTITPATILDPANNVPTQGVFSFVLPNCQVTYVPKSTTRVGHAYHEIVFLNEHEQLYSKFRLIMHVYPHEQSTLFQKISKQLTTSQSSHKILKLRNVSKNDLDKCVRLLCYTVHHTTSWPAALILNGTELRSEYDLDIKTVSNSSNSKFEGSLFYAKIKRLYSLKYNVRQTNGLKGLSVDACVKMMHESKLKYKDHFKKVIGQQAIINNIRYYLDWKRMGDSFQIDMTKQVNDHGHNALFFSLDIIAICIAMVKYVPFIFNQTNKFLIGFPIMGSLKSRAFYKDFIKKRTLLLKSAHDPYSTTQSTRTQKEQRVSSTIKSLLTNLFDDKTKRVLFLQQISKNV